MHMGCKVSIQVHPLPMNNPQDPQPDDEDPPDPPDKDPEEPTEPDEWVDIYGPDYKTEIEV